MKQIMALVLIFFYAAAWTQSDEMINQWKASTWRLNIRLNTSPHGGAVQFAVMDHNPLKGFRDDCRRLRELSAERNKGCSAEELSINELSILTVSWDKQFMDVKGDDVYLLFRDEQCGFSSNTGNGKYYLVTKATMIDDKPAAWVIPFDAVIGSEQDITLDDSNVIILDRVAG